jgi:mRNA interferase MazF
VQLRRGHIVLADFSPARPGEADFVRPAIVVTNDVANARAPVAVVVPLSSNLERVYPFQVLLVSEQTGLDRDSKAQIELLRHISKERVTRILGVIPDLLMREVDQRLREHLAL